LCCVLGSGEGKTAYLYENIGCVKEVPTSAIRTLLPGKSFFSDSIGFIYCDRLFLNGVRCASFGSVIARDEWLATIDAQYLTSSFRLRSASEILGE